jgi:hypothetical protein
MGIYIYLSSLLLPFPLLSGLNIGIKELLSKLTCLSSGRNMNED